MPAPNQLKVNTRLTNVSVGYKNDGYIADEVSPLLPVPKQAGLILEADKSMLQADDQGDDTIGMGEEPGILKTEIRDRTYSTRERARGVTVHDDEVDADNAEEAPYEVKVQKTEAATERLVLNRELRVAMGARAAGIPQSSPTTKWDQAGDVLGDVTPAKLAIKNAIGVPPNYAVVPWEVVELLKQNPSLAKFFSGGATTSTLAVLTSGVLSAIFGVPNILVPRAGQLTGNMTAGFKSGSTTSVWGDNVTLFYRPPVPARQMVAAFYTYVWKNAFRGAATNAKGLVVTENYEARQRTLYIDARRYSDEQTLISEAAYTLTNVLASI
ncbi:hypothetical protein tb265_39000 [Gemmatimonadetes bacterium T265]|nr:hypothetical protein tb265_39000 [Gemmatimonadetes bacterium T265]